MTFALGILAGEVMDIFQPVNVSVEAVTCDFKPYMMEDWEKK